MKPFSLVAGLVACLPLGVAASKPSRWHTNATYTNDASVIAADVYVRWDDNTNAYWAYSTEGADEGYFFGIYTSPDMATWSKIEGGAIKNDSANVWAEDWWWAPECYYNEKTGWYFLFHAGRYLNATKIAEYFKYPDFEEASKIGVAVSRSPAGPFVSIADKPIDYFPFDPSYHDINLLMSPPFLVPPSTHEEGLTASNGTYIPSIDPNVFWDSDGSIWLFFSRNAYRNWIWSDEFERYIEESNIYAVRLDDAWWNDKEAKTMPAVHKSFRDVNKGKPNDWVNSVNSSFPGPTRKDGFVPIISYALQPQVWENAHVYDYQASNGTSKDRRWSEGSTTIRTVDSFGEPVYFLTYSANNYVSPDYGVGYAYAKSVDGPYYKSGSNPILSQDASRGIYSTGHGSIIASAGSNGKEIYYPHHARPSTDADRYLYNARLFVEPDNLYMGFGADAGDLRVPAGVAPYEISAKKNSKGNDTWEVTVKSAQGASFDLSSPQNRIRAELVGAANATVTVNGSTISVPEGTEGQVRVYYERKRANETLPWAEVVQFEGLVGAGKTVSTTIKV
ncbi:glycoside hydrolase family 43 protein [Peniophora sp. CONT]|nr:glycoside hydrolase family 43 protein [Peniophora sp. CONT]